MTLTLCRKNVLTTISRDKFRVVIAAQFCREDFYKLRESRQNGGQQVRANSYIRTKDTTLCGKRSQLCRLERGNRPGSSVTIQQELERRQHPRQDIGNQEIDRSGSAISLPYRKIPFPLQVLTHSVSVGSATRASQRETSGTRKHFSMLSRLLEIATLTTFHRSFFPSHCVRLSPIACFARAKIALRENASSKTSAQT